MFHSHARVDDLVELLAYIDDRNSRRTGKGQGGSGSGSQPEQGPGGSSSSNAFKKGTGNFFEPKKRGGFGKGWKQGGPYARSSWVPSMPRSSWVPPSSEVPGTPPRGTAPGAQHAAEGDRSESAESPSQSTEIDRLLESRG